MSPPRRRKTAARPAARRRAAPARDFWGDLDVDHDHEHDHAVDDDATETGTETGSSATKPALIRPSDHPTALIQSLGAPPLPGGAVAPHYFAAIYERAAALALALAASAGLADTTEFE